MLFWLGGWLTTSLEVVGLSCLGKLELSWWGWQNWHGGGTRWWVGIAENMNSRMTWWRVVTHNEQWQGLNMVTAGSGEGDEW